MILYQYRGQISEGNGFEYLESLFKSGALKFTKPSEFNDPFDCCPTLVGEDPINAPPDLVADMMNRLHQSAISTSHGIVCLTPHPDNMLMWSHYGDQHRSVCVGFDTQILLDNRPLNREGNPLYENIVKVVYSSTRPDADTMEQYFQKFERLVL